MDRRSTPAQPAQPARRQSLSPGYSQRTARGAERSMDQRSADQQSKPAKSARSQSASCSQRGMSWRDTEDDKASERMTRDQIMVQLEHASANSDNVDSISECGAQAALWIGRQRPRQRRTWPGESCPRGRMEDGEAMFLRVGTLRAAEEPSVGIDEKADESDSETSQFD
ncbi:hypothetical protein ACOMHN_046035 [Nucella lapillus]